MSNERDDRGQFVEQTTLADVLGVLRRTDEPMTATEIGSHLGISNRAALDKLERLRDRDAVRRKEVGARAVVWWLVGGQSSEAEIDPEDPFFTAEPAVAGGPTDVSANVDDYLYGSEE